MGLCQAVPLRVGPTISGQLALAWFSPASGTEAQSRFCSGAPVTSRPPSHHFSLSPTPVQMPWSPDVQFPEGEVEPWKGRAGPGQRLHSLGQ